MAESIVWDQTTIVLLSASEIDIQETWYIYEGNEYVWRDARKTGRTGTFERDGQIWFYAYDSYDKDEGTVLTWNVAYNQRFTLTDGADEPWEELLQLYIDSISNN